jgi:hypothetical protein
LKRRGSQPITIALTPSRTSGVAPLAVHFDLTGTTGDNATNPFAELDYWADFDDPSGSFDGGNRGAVVSHVFDAPGTYDVVFYVRDILGNLATRGVTITVSDPDVVFAGTDTVCVASDGDFTGAPSGCTQVTSSDFDAVALAYLGSGKRVLFKKGQTFTSSATVAITATSAAILGAWGTVGTLDARGIDSNAPIVSVAHNSNVLTFGSSGSTIIANDVRVMDIDFRYTNGGTSGHFAAFSYRGDQLLFYRLKNSSGQFNYDFNLSTSVPETYGIDPPDLNCIANCDFSIGSRGYGAYIGGLRWMLLNTAFGTSGSSTHGTRVQFGRKCHFAGMVWAKAASSTHSFTIRAHDHVAGQEEETGSRYHVVDGCTTDCGTVWPWHIGSESTGHEEYVDDVLVDGCVFNVGTGANNSYQIHTGGRRITIANCTVNVNAGEGITSCGLAFVDTYGLSPQAAPEDVRIIHNTVATDVTMSGTIRLLNATSGSNIFLQNNILYAPAATTRTLKTGAATVTVDHNLLDIDPSFVALPGDLHLQSGSAARDYGTPVAWSFRDADGVLRDYTTSPDAGALEYVA